MADALARVPKKWLERKVVALGVNIKTPDLQDIHDVYDTVTWRLQETIHLAVLKLGISILKDDVSF